MRGMKIIACFVKGKGPLARQDTSALGEERVHVKKKKSKPLGHSAFPRISAGVLLTFITYRKVRRLSSAYAWCHIVEFP